MNETERRRSVCEACAAYRRGEIRIETWCRRFDDQPDAARNCEAARNARWAARVTHDGAANACRQWLDADTCPVCRIDDPIPDPELYREQPPPAGWLEDPARIARHFAAFREMMGRDFQPPDGLAGEGIVTYGDARVWPMLVVAAKMLRATGSTLPLQIWHVGPVGEELDGDRYTTLVDADYFAQRHPGRKIMPGPARAGPLPTAALPACCFSIPTPTRWPIRGRCLHCSTIAAWPTGRTCPASPTARPIRFWLRSWREDGWVPPVQAGHLLIDLRKAWTELMLVRWYDNHADFWWRVHAGRGPGRLADRALGDERLPPYWQCRLGGLRVRLPTRRAAMGRASLPGQILACRPRCYESQFARRGAGSPLFGCLLPHPGAQDGRQLPGEEGPRSRGTPTPVGTFHKSPDRKMKDREIRALHLPVLHFPVFSSSADAHRESRLPAVPIGVDAEPGRSSTFLLHGLPRRRRLASGVSGRSPRTA